MNLFHDVQKILPEKIDYTIPSAAVLLVFFISPITVAAGNTADVGYLDIPLTLGVFSGITIIFCSVAFILPRFLFKNRIGWLFAFLARFIFFSCVLSSLLFPLARSEGQVDPSAIPVDRLNLVAVVILGLALSAISVSRMKGPIFAATGAAVVGSLVMNLLAFATHTTDRDYAAVRTASSTSNIFVLGFDGLPRDITLEVLAEEPSFASALSDFTVYENIISYAPATAASLQAELSGAQNLKAQYGTNAEISRALKGERLITNFMAARGVDVTTYGHYSLNLSNAQRAFQLGTLFQPSFATKLDQIAEIGDYSLARVATRFSVFMRNTMRRIVGSIAGTDGQSELEIRTTAHTGADWDISSILSIAEFERYRDELSIGTSNPVAHFFHFTHTHFPVDFNGRCEYQSDDSAWYSSHQNRNGLKDEVRCAVSQFVSFVEHLRQIGAYDNAVIILKSDHGAPVPYNDPDRYEGFAIRGHTLWGFGRYTPFLAIKPKNTQRDEYDADTRSATLVDLPGSLCRLSFADTSACAEFGGHDLFGSPREIPNSYTITIVENADSGFLIDGHEAITLPQTPNFYEELNRYLTDELIHIPAICGSKINVTSGALYNNGLTDNATWATWRDGDDLHLKVAAPDCSYDQIVVETDGAGPIAAYSLRDGNHIIPSKGAMSDYGLTLSEFPLTEGRIEISITQAAAESLHIISVEFR